MERLAEFTDVREIERTLHGQGIGIDRARRRRRRATEGPAHITLKDPDGNVILIDQFF
ncbi:MAG: hypothetical protein R2705_17665 [Ilumatobacteraceae bacterium]